MRESLPGASRQNRVKGQSRKTEKVNGNGLLKLGMKAEGKKSETKTNGQLVEQNSWSTGQPGPPRVQGGREGGREGGQGGRERVSAYRTIRVPHTYNNILTVIATVRVPVDS